MIYKRDREVDHLATGEKMSWAIKESKNTQLSVALKMRVSPSYLSDLLNGKRNWSEALALKFSKALNGKPAKKKEIVYG